MKFVKLKKLLKGYLSKETTPAEKSVVDIWYDSFSTNKGKLSLLEDDAEKEAIRSEIWDKLPIHLKQSSRNRKTKRLWGLGIAATLALFFSWGLYAYFSSSTERIATPYIKPLAAYTSSTASRERKVVILPDSSRVWLNANSTLTVEEAYGDSIRQVYLTGEAFFDIKRDSTTPFMVRTPHLNVKVLGTAFNINAYKNLPQVRVAVEHGKVAVTNEDGMLSQLLIKGQSLSYNIGKGKAIVSDVSSIASWREGRVVLERASFAELSQAIYNIYGVHLHNENNRIQQYSYNLQIHASRSLEQTMDIICSMHRLKYRRDSDDIVLY